MTTRIRLLQERGLPLLIIFGVLVGMSFYARHLAGAIMAGGAYTPLVYSRQVTMSQQPGVEKYPAAPLWDETFAYARYAQQIRRGDWFGNSFQVLKNYFTPASAALGADAATYPYFFDRGGPFVVALLAQLLGDVPRAFAFSDLLFPALVAICACLFCLQLRRSLAFAIAAAGLFVWFNWSDVATLYLALRQGFETHSPILLRTPYPQFALVTFFLFTIALLHFQRAPSVVSALWLGASLALNGYTYIYAWTLAIAVTGMALLVMGISAVKPFQLNRAACLGLLGALALNLALSLPWLAAYVFAPDAARQVITRFANEQVTEPNLVRLSLALVAFILPLLLPRLRMSSRRFWLAFWLGGLVVLNQGRITHIQIQVGHYSPYFFGAFMLIYLLDLVIGLWNTFAPRSASQYEARALTALAVLVVILGFGSMTASNVFAARAQLDFNRQDQNFRELTTLLNSLPQDYAALTTDKYLNEILPAYVTRRFIIPIGYDPMTQTQMDTLKDAAARFFGYANWTALEQQRAAATTTNAASKPELDPMWIIVIVNRHRPNPKVSDFQRVLLTNEDFQVGVWRTHEDSNVQ